MRPDLDQIIAACSVAETGSFSKASDKLGVSKSLVSRRISALEASLNIRLFSRTTSYVALTPIGQIFVERAKRILSDIDDTINHINREMTSISGNVSISAPSCFGTMYINPVIPALLSQHPGLNITLQLNDDMGPDPSDASDLEIRIDRPYDSDYVMRFFKPIKQTLVCSPLYARRFGLPKVPSDILKHECVIYADRKGVDRWMLGEGPCQTVIHPSGRLRTNNWEIVRQAAISGVGLAMMPMFAAKSAIEDGELIEVLTDLPRDTLSLYALFPPRAILPNRTRAVVDFFAARWQRPIADPIVAVKARCA